MKKILVINASARTDASQSRSLSEAFINYWKGKSFNDTFSFRELGNREIPHITRSWIEADAKPVHERTQAEKETLRCSDKYISELHAADVIVLATPMYNWSIPSVLKAYIDQVMRFNEVFTVNPEKSDQRYVGLIKDKTVILLLSRGSRWYEQGERNEHMNFQSAYLKMVFEIMGVQKIHEVSINGTSKNDAQLNSETKEAYRQIGRLIENELHDKR